MQQPLNIIAVIVFLGLALDHYKLSRFMPDKRFSKASKIYSIACGALAGAFIAMTIINFIVR
jgi:hypothetical protein